MKVVGLVVNTYDAIDTELELDPYSKLTRTYTPKGFKELADDIEINGVKEPIAMRNGKILDGRHRYLACKERFVDIPYVDIGDISDEEALDYVISKAISKDSSSTAAKVEAYLLCKAKKVKNNKMHEEFSRLSVNDVKKLSKIVKTDPKYLEILLQQKEILINDKKFKTYKKVSSIHALWSIIVSNEKEDKEYAEVVEDNSLERAEQSFVSSYFNGNETTERRFWDFYNLANSCGDNIRPSSSFGIALMDYIKKNG